jgi:hypothetical protein
MPKPTRFAREEAEALLARCDRAEAEALRTGTSPEDIQCYGAMLPTLVDTLTVRVICNAVLNA